MRQVVLDTETTGLEPEAGHRIIEIGGVELLDRRPTGRVFHTYLNPDRSIDEGAQAVHGISIDDLRDKPRFAQVVDELLGFIVGAELVIHNAAFDLAFLDAELALLRPPRGRSRELVTGVVDSLLLARQKHPGQKNSLDALCRRYDIDDSHRTLHGALLDAGLLADVYLAMTRGQDTLVIDLAPAGGAEDSGPIDAAGLIVLAATPAELAAHEALLDGIAKESKGVVVFRAAALAVVAAG